MRGDRHHSQMTGRIRYPSKNLEETCWELARGYSEADDKYWEARKRFWDANEKYKEVKKRREDVCKIGGDVQKVWRSPECWELTHEFGRLERELKDICDDKRKYLLRCEDIRGKMDKLNCIEVLAGKY